MTFRRALTFLQQDFVANIFSFLADKEIPKDSNKQTEYKYLAEDCFHLSQLGHALVANTYWNAMLTTEDKRDRMWEREFLCPTDDNPFLRTTQT